MRDQDRDELLGWSGWQNDHPDITNTKVGGWTPLRQWPQLTTVDLGFENIRAGMAAREKLQSIMDEVNEDRVQRANARPIPGTKTPYYREGIHRKGRDEFKKRTRK